MRGSEAENWDLNARVWESGREYIETFYFGKLWKNLWVYVSYSVFHIPHSISGISSNHIFLYEAIYWVKFTIKFSIIVLCMGIFCAQFHQSPSEPF